MVTDQPRRRTRLGSRRSWRAASAVIAGCLVASACGGDDGGSDTAAQAEATPTTSEVTTTSQAETTTTAEATSTTSGTPVLLSDLAESGTFHRIGYVAEPGIYITDQLGVDVEFTLDERRQYVAFDGHASFATYPAGENNPLGIFIHETVGLVSQQDMGTRLSRAEAPPNIDPFDTIDTWLEADPRVVVLETGEDTVAGAPAPWWHLEVDSSAGETFSCFAGECVNFIVDPNNGPTAIGDRWQFKVWHLQAFDDKVVTAFLEARPAEWETGVELADEILGSMRLLSNGS